jgi:hypothetical protein
MATAKRITDLTAYTSILPYASELFGVYQPLLGWKSRRIAERQKEGFRNDKPFVLDKLEREFSDLVEIKYLEGGQIDIRIRPGVLRGGKQRAFGSVVLDRVASSLPRFEDYDPSVWSAVITPARLDAILGKDVVDAYSKAYQELRRSDGTRPDGLRFATLSRSGAPSRVASGGTEATAAEISAFERQLRYESRVAGVLLHLQREKAHAVLEEIFYVTRDGVDTARALLRMLETEDGAAAFLDIETLDPTDREHLEAVSLSPISVVHLFRQYFFELDSFLGPPESHVWLSPGSTVELIEVHTRRTTVEKTLETALETLTRAEKSTTEQDELSEAVKEDNQEDVKFGASVKASYASIEATSSFDYGSSQKQARETTHKHMRQQTEKLSSEIRKSVKSTFRTVTEVTDVSSTKHLLTNSGDELINYELRRKMRQVGVQVQDIGTFLCWQTYVDDPGRALGLAKLIHVAKPAELDGIPHPEEIPMLQPFQENKLITIPFVSIDDTGADNEGEVYVDGVEVSDEEWGGEEEHIRADFPQEFVCPKSGYQLTNVEFDPQGKPVSLSRRGDIEHAGDRSSFKLHLDSADFQGQNSVQVKLVLHWSPTAGGNDAIRQKNQENVAEFKQKERVAYEKAYVETVRDRVDVASRIASRRADELREEERIVVYRQLVQEMLMQGVPVADDRTRHVVAELINAIFDVEKMLYFVAPEWWRPRLHRSRQQLQETPPRTAGPLSLQVAGATNGVLARGLARRVETAATQVNPGVMGAHTAGWGGVNDVERDNYFITGESEPAKLGSSLGWLLQLDGDNMRNAFLNAPWVKAVIPIRPGREEAAINWLKGVEGMNGITDDVIYHASNPDEVDSEGDPLEGQRMIDVLLDLARKIRRKYEEGIRTGTFPKQDEVSDPALVDEENTVTATPIDRVYEHGFFPLEGSFRANVGSNYEIFDQWLEVLPTDQVVPVEVAYDPKTGRQI